MANNSRFRLHRQLRSEGSRVGALRDSVLLLHSSERRHRCRTETGAPAFECRHAGTQLRARSQHADRAHRQLGHLRLADRAAPDPLRQEDRGAGRPERLHEHPAEGLPICRGVRGCPSSGRRLLQVRSRTRRSAPRPVRHRPQDRCDS